MKGNKNQNLINFINDVKISYEYYENWYAGLSVDNASHHLASDIYNSVEPTDQTDQWVSSQ